MIGLTYIGLLGRISLPDLTVNHRHERAPPGSWIEVIVTWSRRLAIAHIPAPCSLFYDLQQPAMSAAMSTIELTLLHIQDDMFMGIESRSFPPTNNSLGNALYISLQALRLSVLVPVFDWYMRDTLR